MSTTPTPQPTAWDHASTLIGGIAAVTFGVLDHRYFGVLSSGLDTAVCVAGLGVLGLKSLTQYLPVGR